MSASLHRVRMFLQGIASAELVWMLARQTPGMQDGRYREQQFVADDSYAFAVTLNEGFQLRTPAERNACFLMEPPEKCRPRPHPSIGTLFSFNPDDRAGWGDRWVHRHMDSFLHAATLPPGQPHLARKPKRMSMVVSGKSQTPCHRRRMELAQALVASGAPVDLYGRDWTPGVPDARVIGPLPRIDKTAALRPYVYSIACENSLAPGYLSEKFLDCLVNDCIPITNSRTPIGVFPSGSYVYLDPDLPLDAQVAFIEALCRDPVPPVADALAAAKDMVLSGDWCLAEAIRGFVRAAHARSPVPQQVHAMPITPVAPDTSATTSQAKLPLEREPVLTCLFLTRGRLPYLERTLASIRQHLREIEPDIPTACICCDNGSDPAAQARLLACGFDAVILNQRNRGIGPAMNQLVANVRTPWILNLQDDWVVQNPRRLPFIRFALSIMASDPRLSHLKLDDCHFLDFTDRAVYDGPHRADGADIDFFVQDPRKLWGGFCFPPAITRTSALHALGPFREDQPFRRGWAESEYTQRYAGRYLAAKSPDLLIFHHIGDEPTAGWQDRGTDHAVSLPTAVAGAPAPGAVAARPLPSAPLPTLAVIIPSVPDSPERAENAEVVREHLQRFASGSQMVADIVMGDHEGIGADGGFPKAAIVNRAVARSTGAFLALIDADAIVPEAQLREAIERLQQGADVVYPYDGAFLDVPREFLPSIRRGDIESVLSQPLPNLNPASVGGSVLIRRTAFWAGGALNEHFRGWGREDVEFHHRFQTLGYRIERVPGPLLHLAHPRVTSGHRDHPGFAANEQEFARISALDRYALLDEVAAWPWVSARTGAQERT